MTERTKIRILDNVQGSSVFIAIFTYFSVILFILGGGSYERGFIIGFFTGLLMSICWILSYDNGKYKEKSRKKIS